MQELRTAKEGSFRGSGTGQSLPGVAAQRPLEMMPEVDPLPMAKDDLMRISDTACSRLLDNPSRCFRSVATLWISGSETYQ